jgi:hypothetical protein
MDPEIIKALREAEEQRRKRNEEIIARAEARRKERHKTDHGGPDRKIEIPELDLIRIGALLHGEEWRYLTSNKLTAETFITRLEAMGYTIARITSLAF